MSVILTCLVAHGGTSLSLTGLNQGYLPSPTLFQIDFDSLLDYLDTHCPDGGVVLSKGYVSGSWDTR
jgi:hypothetical protein